MIEMKYKKKKRKRKKKYEKEESLAREFKTTRQVSIGFRGRGMLAEKDQLPCDA